MKKVISLLLSLLMRLMFLVLIAVEKVVLCVKELDGLSYLVLV